jgi:release factor glutamine methyltransferase
MNIKQICYHNLVMNLEVEILLANVLNVNRAYLHCHSERNLTQNEMDRFYSDVARRQKGEPIAYIIGKKEFWSLDFKVTKDTLIPRPETELLVETVFSLWDKSKPLKLLELGTGSGAIAISIAKECSNFHVTATDISKDALIIAEENKNHHQIKNIDFIQSDWFMNIKDKFDMIVSNPPYISEDDPHLLEADLRFEPIGALSSGKTGLEAISHILAHAKKYLFSQGCVLLEHGYNQGEIVKELFLENRFFKVRTLKDINGLARVTFGFLSGI